MNIHWQENELRETNVPDQGMIDLHFGISGQHLQSDFGLSLQNAIARHLTWIPSEPSVGIYLKHGPDSGNGWQRPIENGVIQLSHRTRLTLRLPSHRVASGHWLTGKQLLVDDFILDVGKGHTKQLLPCPTLFSQHVVMTPEPLDEADFTNAIVADFHTRDIEPRKLLCGREHVIRSASGTWTAHSLMVADLEDDESLDLQVSGLGLGRAMGCGVFHHHKSISPIRRDGDD